MRPRAPVGTRIVSKFLDDHPECVKTKKPKRGKSATPGRGTYTQSPQAFQIAEFLGDNWGEHKVNNSLQRLGLIEEEKLDRGAIESLPTDTAARTFASAVKSDCISLVTPRFIRAKSAALGRGTYTRSPEAARISEFLEEHPEIVKELRLTNYAAPGGVVGHVIISRFLPPGWGKISAVATGGDQL